MFERNELARVSKILRKESCFPPTTVLADIVLSRIMLRRMSLKFVALNSIILMVNLTLTELSVLEELCLRVLK